MEIITPNKTIVLDPKGVYKGDDKVIQNIRTSIRNRPKDFQAYKDYFTFYSLMAEQNDGGDKTRTLSDNLWLRNRLSELIAMKPSSEIMIAACQLLKTTYRYSAKDVFTDYMTYLEWNRKPRERFWLPRARILTPLANAMQDLADNKLDELFLSQPPRTGKTTLMMFFNTWIIGRDPERSNLYSAFSDTITSAFYSGVLEVIDDDYTYLWKEVFPEAKIAGTNAKEETIDIGRKKRYKSLTCRSLYGTLNGACDANGILIGDDLIGGIEEAMNKDRLVSAWAKVDNNLIPRAKESCKLLWIGTRWSMSDPAGIRMELLQSDKRFANHRYKIINLPALNEKGESNFDYDYGVGFSTSYYQMRKASFARNNDDASWSAQYMGEPVERSGTLFSPDEMRYFNGDLPEDAGLIRKFMVVDPAFGGGDYCAAAICYQYDIGIFVTDVVFSSADKKFTQPELANRILEWEVTAVQFECTASTAAYKEKVEELVREHGYRCNITYKAAPTNVSKEVRIYDKAPDIRDMYFLEPQSRSNEYEQFMANVFSFHINGKNKHDDAPDVLAQAVEMANSAGYVVKIRKRNF